MNISNHALLISKRAPYFLRDPLIDDVYLHTGSRWLRLAASSAIAKGFTCDDYGKAVQITKSKTGKHGHATCRSVALDIFTAKKYGDLCFASHVVEVPFVERT